VVSDELAEAERRARLLRETDGAHYVGLPRSSTKLVRLRAVEKAAPRWSSTTTIRPPASSGCTPGSCWTPLTDALNGDVT